MKEGKLNHYIPQLVGSSKDYIRDFRKKIALSTYLRNFNTKASKDLTKFINNSTTRYQEVKAGNAIEPTLNQTVKACSPLSHSILTNKFYTDLNLKDDEAKLRRLIKKGNENQNIIKLIRDEQMKDEYTKIELRFREYLNNLILEKKGMKKEIKNNELNSKKKNLSNYSTDKCKADTFYLQKIIKDDQDLVNNQIEQYYNRTNHLKNFLSETNPDELKKKKQQIFYINVDNLKMLKYHKPIVPQNNIKKETKDEDEIDLKKFIPYTKPTRAQIKKMREIRKSHFNYPRNLKYDTLSDDDFVDTRRVVTEEANNLYFLKEKFHNKSKIIMDKVNIDFPQLEDYSDVIKTKLKERKEKRINDNLKRSQFLSKDDQRRLKFNITLKNTFEKFNLDPKELDDLYI